MLGNILKVGDLLVKIRDGRNRSDERLAHYVERIADDADELARIWTEVLTSLLQSKEMSTQDHEGIFRFIDRPRVNAMANFIPYSRLDEFYNRLHYVFGIERKEKADILLDKLAN